MIIHLRPENWFQFFKEIKDENDIFQKFEEIFSEELESEYQVMLVFQH